MYQVPQTETIIKKNGTLVITEFTKNGCQIFKVTSKKIWLGSHFLNWEWETIEGALNLMISTCSQELNNADEMDDKTWNSYYAMVYNCNQVLAEIKESK